MQKAENAYDKALAAEARTAFLDGSPESELLKKENIPFLISSATSTDSKAYKIMNNNKAKIDAEMGAGKANEALASVLLRTLVIPKAQAAEIADFDSLEKEIAANYPEVDMSDMLRQFKPQHYYQKQNWPKFKDAVNALILSTPNTVSANSLNSFAWAIFENCADVACIKAALDWSKTAVEKEENAAFYDTYANLLHKAGDQKNAVLWAEKALAIAEASDKETYQTVLEKIKAGSPTWE